MEAFSSSYSLESLNRNKDENSSLIMRYIELIQKFLSIFKKFLNPPIATV